MKTIRELKLNDYFKPYRKQVLIGFFFVLSTNFFVVWVPYYTRVIVDGIEQYYNNYQFSPDSTFFEIAFMSEVGLSMLQNVGLLIGTSLLSGVMLFYTRRTLIVTSRKIEYDMRNDIFDKITLLPQSYYDTQKSGTFYTLATEDVQKIREYYGPVVMYMMNTVIRSCAIISVMFWVSVELTLWSLMIMPLLAIGTFWIGFYVNIFAKRIQTQHEVLAEKITESFSNISLIKAYNLQKWRYNIFKDASYEYRNRKLKLSFIESLFHPSLGFLIGFSVIIILWKGGMMNIEGQVSYGNIAEFIIYISYITWPIASLGYTIDRYLRAKASWGRVRRHILQQKNEQDQYLNKKPQHLLKLTTPMSIRFDDVSFRYPNGHIDIISHLSLNIASGEKVGIIGRSGVGKTTLAWLIPRIYEPSSGAIYINDVPMKNISFVDLRHIVSIVTQEPMLFSMSIADNISYGGRKDMSKEEIIEIAKKANLWEDIQKFNDSLDTLLGEKGVNLSGGQKLRLTLARALASDAKIYVFDDIFSAVDSKTEHIIMKNIMLKLKQETLIFISHRISTVMHLDRIFLMENGVIIEQGNHQELMQKKEKYYDIYNKQLIEESLA